MTEDTVDGLTIHNTRLFPKGSGATAYRLTGIAARCDWAIMTDRHEDEACLHGDTSSQPRTVFLSLRSLFSAIPYFYHEILPNISEAFVLVSGSEDITIPNQVDKRWRPHTIEEKALIHKIVTDDRVIHWFIENRDVALPKTSTLPVGYVLENESKHVETIHSPLLKIKDKPLKVLCAHRVRDGSQWEVRKNLTAFCNERFQNFSTVLTAELSELNFLQQIREHPFILCAQGGGLDPSPKAWLSIANGSIPIIKSSTLNDAYSQLPVVIIDEWNDSNLNVENLQRWVKELSPFYDDPTLRSEVLDKLSLNYWWKKIENKIKCRENSIL